VDLEAQAEAMAVQVVEAVGVAKAVQEHHREHTP
jgi:hypothetical protein